MISYRKNCEEIIRLHQKSGSPGQLLALFDLTKGVETKSKVYCLTTKNWRMENLQWSKS